EVLEAADAETDVVRRAGRAAGLAAILRAVYNALVARLCSDDDSHRRTLEETLEAHRDDVSKLDISDMRTDAVAPPRFLRFFEEARNLVLEARHATDLLGGSIASHLTRQETLRKGRRARLGDRPWHRSNQRTWKPATVAPLDYRWRRVHQHLADLLED